MSDESPFGYSDPHAEIVGGRWDGLSLRVVAVDLTTRSSTATSKKQTWGAGSSRKRMRQTLTLSIRREENR